MASAAICSKRVGAVGLVAATGAAVVEGDRAVGPRQRQPLQVPAVLVGAEALDQQHRRAAAATGDLVVDAGAVGRRRVRHVSSRPSPTAAASRARSRSGCRRTRRAAAGCAVGPGRPARARSVDRADGVRDGCVGPISMRADRPSGELAVAAGNTAVRVATAAPISAWSTRPTRRGCSVGDADITSSSPARSAPATSSGRASSPPRRRARAPIGAMSGRPTKRAGRPVSRVMARAAWIGGQRPPAGVDHDQRAGPRGETIDAADRPCSTAARPVDRRR